MVDLDRQYGRTLPADTPKKGDVCWREETDFILLLSDSFVWQSRSRSHRSPSTCCPCCWTWWATRWSSSSWRPAGRCAPRPTCCWLTWPWQTCWSACCACGCISATASPRSGPSGWASARSTCLPRVRIGTRAHVCVCVCVCARARSRARVLKLSYRTGYRSLYRLTIIKIHNNSKTSLS